MTFIKDNVFQYLSVKLPALGAFIMLVLIPALQVAVDYQIIPTKYHAFITGGVMLVLTMLGRKIYQPSLHTQSDDAPSVKETAKQAVKTAAHDAAYRELHRQMLKKSKRR
ncbi:hypothetical protein [Moraxella sp. ZY200743]|uniref:hypothetical protein n=1 Tax=Moraxella sp. ZY200743 TaxID=2911970 RepID=UPI003D7D7DA9